MMPLLLLRRRGAPVVDWSLLSAIPADLTFLRASTGSRYNALGVLENLAVNTPRFDYDPATLAPRGLLMEPQRQNFITNSRYNTGWTAFGGTLASNVTTSLDGTVNAATLTEDTSTGQHYLSGPSEVAYTSGTTYTLSTHVKAGTATVVQIVPYSGAFGGTVYANFDVQNGVVGTQSGGVSSIVNCGNGWYRCIFVLAATTTATGNGGTIVLTNNNASASRLPSYTGASRVLSAWGGQCETGAFASSYIPTSGTSLTRAADSLYTTSLPWFNQAQGTVLIDFMLEGLQTGTFPEAFELSDGTNNTKLFTYCNGTTSQFALKAYNSGAGLFDIGGGTLAAFTSYKGGGSYSSTSGYVRALNGTTQTAAITTIPAGITRLQLFGGVAGGSTTPAGWVRRFRGWNIALDLNTLKQEST